MRWLLAAVFFVLALGTLRVVGCGETTGTGGDGGNGGVAGSGGNGGTGGVAGHGGDGGTGGVAGDGGTGGVGGQAGFGGSAGEGGSAGSGGVGGVGGRVGCVYEPPGTGRQHQQDAITCINGEAPPTDAGTVYFSAENCADAANTLYDLTLANAGGVTQVFLWVGIENAGCEQVSNRSDQLDVCREVSGNPRTVRDKTTVFDLTLHELVATGIVDCTVLEGRQYQIYSFRDEDPGGNDVAPEGYGVAPFKVGVNLP